MKCKVFLLIGSFLIMVNITAQSYLSFPVAKFKTGNDIAWKERNYDDSDWQEIKTSLAWERQGYTNYDGYAWYRIHFFLSSSLLNQSYLQDKLNFYLARIDDADEAYLNGKLIGKTGRAPADPGGFFSRWEILRNYIVDLKDPAVLWDQENVLAIKVYDNESHGGMYGDIPSLQLYDLIDGLEISHIANDNYSESKYQINLNNRLQNSSQIGSLQIFVEDTDDGRIIQTISEDIRIDALKEISKQVSFPGNKRVKICIIYIDEKTKKSKEKEIISSYILTPPAKEEPQINGPEVYGAYPGNPFLFTIAASGLRPMTYEAKGLPKGLVLDNKTGIISGTTKKHGDFKVVLTAKNTKGTATRELLIKMGDKLALTPPLGWNSWNCWGLMVDHEKILQSARAFKEKGFSQYGWSYINLDGGWQDKRDNDGRLVPNKKFPNMKVLADSIHSMGLKFGIYTSPGPRDCAGYLGSYQHEKQDIETFAGWGVDYLKYDWCYYSEVFEQQKDSSASAYMKPYLLMQKYLRNQSRDIIYSLCQYGFKNVWEWGAAIGNSGRTTWDITDTWESMSDIGFSQYPYHSFAKPGYWNDPDMLVIGKMGWGEDLHDSRLTPDEQYTHISLWSLLASPLLIGCDLNQLDAFTLSLLTNAEVLAVNQDPLGKQAQRLIVDNNIQIWAKDLQDGSKAVGIFNLGNRDENYDLILSSLGYSATKQVRDIWRQKDMPYINSSIRIHLPSHGVSLLRIR